MEIVIGREVNGTIDIKVDKKFNLVSRQHAKLVYKDGSLKIKDLDSANGTFVNGKQVASKKINKEDIVLLGSDLKNKGYQVDITKLIEDVENLILEEKTDFSKEFDSLKTVYKSYKKEIEVIQKSSQIKSVKPRLMFSLGIGLILLVLTLFGLTDGLGTLQYPIMMIVMLVPTIMGAYGKKVDISEDITTIQIKYGKKYCCPKCKKKLQLNKAWRLYKDEETCPYKCGAKY